MTEFFLSYGLFALKTLTLVGLVGLLVVLIISSVLRSTERERDHFEIHKLNERIEREREMIASALMDDAAHHAFEKDRRAREKRERKARKKDLARTKKRPPVPEVDQARRQVFVLDFDGDLAATAVGSLRREVSALLSLPSRPDEIVVRLESSGGLVHSYGLAASQLERVKASGVKLTVCVDKVAASGGYMMACVADKILAAPFAVLGSIGVVAQIPNFHRLLKKNDVDFELMTAGKYKRTLTVFGENTSEGRAKFQEELESTHGLFKEFVSSQRPVIAIDEVATGEVWLGKQALEKNLVDDIKTSDAYIAERCAEADVFEIRFEKKKSLQDKLASSLETAADRVLARLFQRATDRIPSA